SARLRARRKRSSHRRQRAKLACPAARLKRLPQTANHRGTCSRKGIPSLVVMRSLPRTLTLLAVSCDPTAPTVRTPVQVVGVIPPPDHGIAGNPAAAAERTAPPAAVRFPELCRASVSDPERAETTAAVSLPFGTLSVHVVHRSHSVDDICVATLTDARGS